jgi:hypothetical protein
MPWLFLYHPAISIYFILAAQGKAFWLQLTLMKKDLGEWSASSVSILAVRDHLLIP